jgi:hypothetical protein
MTDLAHYGEWNPFVVGVRAREQPVRVGTLLELEVKWGAGGGARTVERVIRLEPPAAAGEGQKAVLEYCFTGFLPRFHLVSGSRAQELQQATPQAPTVYRTHEPFFGLLARAVPLKKVQAGFEQHARALKTRVESLVRA